MIIRFERNHKRKHGWFVADENKVRVIEGDLYKRDGKRPVMTGLEVPFDEVKLLTPCTPSKMIVVEWEESSGELSEPVILSSSALRELDQTLAVSDKSATTAIKSGMAVVVKKEASQISAADADDYILGFTCSLALIHGSGEKEEPSLWLGPVIAPKLDYANVQLATSVNHEQKLTSTSPSSLSIPHLLEQITREETLAPSDVVVIAAKSSLVELKAGDHVSVTIDGIGTLSNLIQG